jgi:hypothetical protein
MLGDRHSSTCYLGSAGLEAVMVCIRGHTSMQSQSPGRALTSEATYNVWVERARVLAAASWRSEPSAAGTLGWGEAKHLVWECALVAQTAQTATGQSLSTIKELPSSCPKEGTHWWRGAGDWRASRCGDGW